MSSFDTRLRKNGGSVLKESHIISDYYNNTASQIIQGSKLTGLVWFVVLEIMESKCSYDISKCKDCKNTVYHFLWSDFSG